MCSRRGKPWHELLHRVDTIRQNGARDTAFGTVSTTKAAQRVGVGGGVVGVYSEIRVGAVRLIKYCAARVEAKLLSSGPAVCLFVFLPRTRHLTVRNSGETPVHNVARPPRVGRPRWELHGTFNASPSPSFPPPLLSPLVCPSFTAMRRGGGWANTEGVPLFHLTEIKIRGGTFSARNLAPFPFRKFIAARWSAFVDPFELRETFRSFEIKDWDTFYTWKYVCLDWY